MEELDKALAEVTTGLVDLTRQVGPEAAEAVLKAVQLGGLFSILGCVLVLAVTTPVLFRCVRALMRAADSTSSVDKDIAVPVASVIGLGAGILFFIALWAIALPGQWISAFDPAAGLAWKLLEKL